MQRGSDGLRDLAGLETARADVGPDGFAADDGPNTLEVGVEAAAGRNH